ncbi:MAG: hypothetical protein H6810_07555 [Phycisphaeraceae bacterium]|nr:MAG: hypothetical protein H6810_07555 [Phycisphaeraceae bacterium]
MREKLVMVGAIVASAVAFQAFGYNCAKQTNREDEFGNPLKACVLVPTSAPDDCDEYGAPVANDTIQQCTTGWEVGRQGCEYEPAFCTYLYVTADENGLCKNFEYVTNEYGGSGVNNIACPPPGPKQ